jgi:hypothetical protein
MLPSPVAGCRLIACASDASLDRFPPAVNATRPRPSHLSPGPAERQVRSAPGRLASTTLIAVILAVMETTGLGWCGTRTGRCSELAHFYEHVLGLRLVHAEADFWAFELPDGRHVEIFGSSYPGKDHFATGPVVGFAVRDLPAAVDELRRADVELLGEPGPTWQHFRGPDGNVYELVTS